MGKSSTVSKDTTVNQVEVAEEKKPKSKDAKYLQRMEEKLSEEEKKDIPKKSNKSLIWAL